MQVVLVVVGAVFGLAFASGSVGLFGGLFGALVGFLLSEMLAARRRISELESEVKSLRAGVVTRERTAPSAADYYSRSATGDVEQPKSVTAAPVNEPVVERPSVPEPTATSIPPRRETGPAAAADAASRTPASAWKRPVEPTPPPDPEWLRVVRDYFTGGNTVVRVGIVILFIGMAFLLRYVAEHTNVPIEFRLAGVALAGVVLLVLGWRLRLKRPGYAMALQGGAIGILYLTVFTSLRLFHVLPPGPAFLILVLISALCAALAVLQNSMAFAVLATGFGFLSPVLASTGQGNHVVLFSYYLILNLGILAIAWFKAWRPLNVVGFLFTFMIGTAWGVLRYKRDFLSTTEPFLIAFFVLYIAIAVLFSLRQRPELRGYVDGTLVFGAPVVAFGLQSALVQHIPFAMAYGAAAASALYLVLAWVLHNGKRETQRLLVEAFLALGVAFATLAVPLALDGRWSAATWALEGVALIWVGCRQGRRLPRAAGALLQIAGGLIFLFDVADPAGAIPVLNSSYLGAVMIAVASVVACRILEKSRDTLSAYENLFSPVLFFWGAIWWLVSGITEISRHVDEEYVAAAVLVFLTATALISSEIHRRLSISVARLPPLVLLPVMAVAVPFSLELVGPHPSEGGGWLAWPLALTGFYFWLRRAEEQEDGVLIRTYHIASALVLVTLVSWEVSWQIDAAVKGGGSWPAIAWALIPALSLLILPALCSRVAWPFVARERAYIVGVGSVLAVFLSLWSVGTNLSMRGDPFPLPYVPLLNPLDLAHAFVLLVLMRYALHLHRARPDLDSRPFAWALAGLLFVWLNAVLLRTLHHLQSVPYEPDELFRSTLVQTSLSIFWTVLALATMLIATRRAKRLVWIVGASLMAVVIAKLFLIDLSRVGTVERIVSFVGVGVLMLVVGYFSPLPPARQEATT